MEKFLRRCLDSLIIKDVDLFSKLEVLVVNDGSKDSSSTIAHEYQNNHPGVFRVIDKENGNYGSCVNRGLNEAKGEYIKILDADDWFDNDAFFYYIQKLSHFDQDLIITDFNIVTNEGIIKYHKERPELDEGEYEFSGVIRNLLSYHLEMHALTYRTSKVKELSYRQTEGISYTDSEWVFEPMLNVKSVYYLKTDLYQYVIGREGQTMDPKIVLKSISQSYMLIDSLLGKYNFRIGQVSGLYKKWLNERMVYQMSIIYKLLLLDHKGYNKEALSFDDLVKSRNEFLYEYCNLISLKHMPFFKYVKYWRKNGRIDNYKFRIVRGFYIILKGLRW